MPTSTTRMPVIFVIPMVSERNNQAKTADATGADN
jgi:hypothetical protein